jgi:hypothetical protein
MHTITIGNKQFWVSDDGFTLYDYTGEGPIVPEAVVLAATEIAPYLPVLGDGNIADSANIAHINKLVGIARNFMSNNQAGDVQYAGEMINPDWAFVIGDRIYVKGSDISNVVPSLPTDAWIQQVGVAIRPDTVMLDIKEAHAL